MNNFSVAEYIAEQEYNEQTNGTTSIMSLSPASGVYLSGANIIANETITRTLLITKNPKICQGKPIIRGTRISVTNITELYYLSNWDIQKIKDEYPQLNEQQILAALDYYETHTKEIDTYLQEEKEVDATDKPA
jgi:uncharacterized protein (DUF433 family)